MEMETSNEMIDETELVPEENIKNEFVPTEIVNNNEFVHDETINNGGVHDDMMNAELVPVVDSEPQPMDSPQPLFDSEMQVDMLEYQPDAIQTPETNKSDPEPKRRRKKSIVWEHFTIENVGGGSRRASCKNCKQSFAYSTGSKVAGTSHLKRHIAKGTCPVVLSSQERNALSPYSLSSKSGTPGTQKRRYYRTASIPHVTFDADRCRHEIAQMIVMHDYPLHMVEHPGFISFVKNLQPRFDMVSFNAVQGDCIATFLREKQNIQKVIETMPGRVSLTLDLWSSTRTTGYVFVTGQFIDSDWKIHRKLLNVIMEPFPDSDMAFSHAVAASLSDWNMGGKLFSVTINQPLSDPAVENLRALLSVKNPLVLTGQLLVGNCLARSLSEIVQTALASVKDAVKKVRDSVKYVKTSESREEKFLELKQQLQVPGTKSLYIDDQTKWDTTYEMLLAASESREVFSCLDTSDPDYKNAPSAEDWKEVETLCTYMKPVFDTANLLTTAKAQTTNTFFHEAWKIQLELARATASEDEFVSSLTKLMQQEFDKYWKSCCFILAIAVVMDPRFKMKLVEFSFSKIYGAEAATYVKIVDEGIHELFHEYVSLPQTATQNNVANGTTVQQVDQEGNSSNGVVGLIDFDAYIMETTSQQMRSELDQYLEESLLPRVHEFDVIGWWKVNRMKYPTLSKMARDILSIPVCTVPGSSVFCNVRKEMDDYRCDLRPETVEALICAKDWLQSDKVVEAPVQVVKMETPI